MPHNDVLQLVSLIMQKNKFLLNSQRNFGGNPLKSKLN